jgi:hypothetical protein
MTNFAMEKLLPDPTEEGHKVPCRGPGLLGRTHSVSPLRAGRSRGTTARSKRTSVGPSSSRTLKRSLFSVRIGTITHVLPIGR